MSLHQEVDFRLPSTLEPKQDGHSTFESVITQTSPTKGKKKKNSEYMFFFNYSIIL